MISNRFFLTLPSNLFDRRSVANPSKLILYGCFVYFVTCVIRNNIKIVHKSNHVFFEILIKKRQSTIIYDNMNLITMKNKDDVINNLIKNTYIKRMKK